MSQNPGPKSPMAGGIAIAILSVAGVIIGSMQGQPSLGLVGGFAAGTVVALAVWLLDRTRR
ncbi:hypothetical protein [Sphingobium boeckii]|uniref:Uncharacterized membrane protein (UPF0136 family) n=1 Tax=Sphingobium boeckii TaxID=1082345 RepID=A0A7W9AHX9_9SPHN|nr:hypothetical protein [Sphingobium boeckii]MBB5686020.1 uncharacterized membrane protein (UPF0136 family) [Sphingobium boeckii]